MQCPGVADHPVCGFGAAYMGSAAWPCSIQTKWCDIMGLFGDRHCIYRDNRRGDNGSSVIISKKGNLKSPGQLTEWGGCLSVDTDVFPAAEQAAADVVTEMEAAVKVLLQGLGEDPEREGLVKTPLRVAQAFLSATRGTTFRGFAFLFSLAASCLLLEGALPLLCELPRSNLMRGLARSLSF